MYKCKDCGRQFIGGERRDKSQVITDYVEGKQTLDQLALKYGVNERTIRRDLEGMRYVQKISKDKHVTIQMDTTYWGQSCMVDGYQPTQPARQHLSDIAVTEYGSRQKQGSIPGPFGLQRRRILRSSPPLRIIRSITDFTSIICTI